MPPRGNWHEQQFFKVGGFPPRFLSIFPIRHPSAWPPNDDSRQGRESGEKLGHKV
jgi:hypothetical protein